MAEARKNFNEIGEKLYKICDDSYRGKLSQTGLGKHHNKRQAFIDKIKQIAEELKDDKIPYEEKFTKFEFLAKEIDEAKNNQITKLGNPTTWEKLKGTTIEPAEIKRRGADLFKKNIQSPSLDHIFSKFLERVKTEITHDSNYEKRKESAARRPSSPAAGGAGAGS